MVSFTHIHLLDLLGIHSRTRPPLTPTPERKWSQELLCPSPAGQLDLMGKMSWHKRGQLRGFHIERDAGEKVAEARIPSGPDMEQPAAGQHPSGAKTTEGREGLEHSP